MHVSHDTGEHVARSLEEALRLSELLRASREIRRNGQQQLDRLLHQGSSGAIARVSSQHCGGGERGVRDYLGDTLQYRSYLVRGGDIVLTYMRVRGFVQIYLERLRKRGVIPVFEKFTPERTNLPSTMAIKPPALW